MFGNGQKILNQIPRKIQITYNYIGCSIYFLTFKRVCKIDVPYVPCINVPPYKDNNSEDPQLGANHLDLTEPHDGLMC